MKILGFAGLALGLASAAAAQTTPARAPAAPDAARVAPDPFAQALAVRSVADFARRQHDPVAMITAARMLQEIPFADAAGGEASFTPAGLFEEAKILARGDQMLLMQITVAQSTGNRGVMTSAFGKGLVRRMQTVEPQAAYRFDVEASGGAPLRVGAIGDIGTALSMRLMDPAGKTVCLDDHGDYGPVCQVLPKASTKYRVDIVNKSAVKSRAVILSN